MECVNYELDNNEQVEDTEQVVKQPICKDCRDKCIECLFSILKGAGHR